jgi:hypothetical protein
LWRGGHLDAGARLILRVATQEIPGAQVLAPFIARPRGVPEKQMTAAVLAAVIWRI